MDELKDAIAKLQKERADAVNRVAVIDRALAALRELAGEKVNGELPIGRRRGGENANALAPQIVEELAVECTASDVIEELERRGLQLDAADPLNAVRTALSRAAKSGRLERVGYGVYRSAPSTGSDAISVVRDVIGIANAASDRQDQLLG